MRCRNHTYVYYSEPWIDDTTGVNYKQGYYDETGKYYDADDIAFKRQDGSYTAHFVCEYCGSEAELVWTEGVYPTCNSCGAQMTKELTYVDDVIKVESYQRFQRHNGSNVEKLVVKFVVAVFIVGILSQIVSEIALFKYAGKGDAYSYEDTYSSGNYSNGDDEITNIDIYGTDIYLDKVDDNTYVICKQTDDYEKHLTWDYGADSYYDYDSDCYLWYNTDVSPNLWQYWYEDIAGSDYYGWMECEGTTWYIEVSDTEWKEYTGDTTSLWHIQNQFD